MVDLGSGLVDIGSNLDDIGPDVVRICSSRSKYWTHDAQPSVQSFAPFRPNVGRNRPELIEPKWATSAQNRTDWVKLGENGQTWRTQPEFGGPPTIRRCSARCAPSNFRGEYRQHGARCSKPERPKADAPSRKSSQGGRPRHPRPSPHIRRPMLRLSAVWSYGQVHCRCPWMPVPSRVRPPTRASERERDTHTHTCTSTISVMFVADPGRLPFLRGEGRRRGADQTQLDYRPTERVQLARRLHNSSWASSHNSHAKRR